MRYFIAVESAEKPFILWASVANSTQEYEALGYDENPLVIAESALPQPVSGVCPLKIVAGALVERTAPEMAAFAAEWSISEAIKNNNLRLDHINKGSFSYLGKDFPMDEVSRLFYHCIEKLRGNQKIMTTSNELFNLLDSGSNIDDFLGAYYNELLLTTKHEI